MSKPIPQPPGLPFLGNITSLDPSNPGQGMKLLADKYGEIVKISILGQERYIVTSERLVRELCDEKRFCKAVAGPLEQVRNGVGDGLFTAYHGEPNWGVAHRSLTPAFGPLGIKAMYDEMYDIATQLVAKWARTGDERINTTDDYTRLTLDSIALCAMGKRFNSFYRKDMHPFVGAMVDFLAESGARTRKTRLELLLNSGPTRRYEADIQLMKEVSKEVIDHRRANPTDKKDLLNAMLFGKDPKTGQRLTDEGIMNNMITFLIAGHETTSGMLSYTSYYMLKNPDAMQKAQKEVDEVVGKGPVKYEHMSKLHFLEACLREALRLSPTAPAFTVRPLPGTKEPLVLGGDYLIPPNAEILVWLPVLHRDAVVYGADAEEYKPERMYEKNFTDLPPAAWKPFGNGGRGCIGRPFAWQEALLALALILQNFTLRMDDPSYQLKNKSTLTTKPDGFYMRATLREGIDPITLERKMFAGIGSNEHEAEPVKAAAGKGGKPMTILYGSNSGTCEGLAQALASSGGNHGFDATVKPLDAAVDQFPVNHPVVIITASYEGNPPDNAGLFVEWLKNVEPSKLEGAKVAVYGCGHSDWAATYQKVPKVVESLLLKKGASSIVSRGETNVAEGKIFDDFDAWTDTFWPALGSKSTNSEVEGLDMELSTSSRSSHLRQFVQDALVLKNERLTPDGIPEKRHMQFKLPSNMAYEAGDYLAILPINNIETISRVLRRFSLPWDTMMTLKKGAHSTIPTETELSVTAVLGAYVELKSAATKRNLNTLARYATEEDVQLPTESNLSLLDILEKYPSIPLPFSVYLSMLPPMRIRQYSMASSPLADPSVASITFSVVNQNTADRPHLGVATNYLRTLTPGSTVQLTVKKSHASFHLPLDDNTPVIMIGAGTGLAPFLGFIQERAAKIQAGKKLGPAVLFIGCRHPEQDRIHADELTQWEKENAVTIYYAFSRAPEISKGCKYAQDRLYEEGEMVSDLFNRGARVYICGSSSLGKGVADSAAKLAVEKAKRKGEELDQERSLKWWESLRNERYAVDVFD